MKPIRVALMLMGLMVFCTTLAQDMIVQTVTFSNANLELKGFLYRPQGSGPFPAVVYNHGSEKNLAYIDKLAVPFVQQGYVFFAPNRRGHGRSPGTYILDVLNSLKGAEWSRALVKLHEEQLSDQLSGVVFLKTQAFVDANRIGVFGWSFGGIQTMLAVERANAGYRAAVNCAGAAQTWAASSDLQARLTAAARNAVMPVLFMQAQNDYSLTALQVLSEEMRKAGKPYEVKVFPAFGSSNQDGHNFCAQGAGVWGADVFDFLSRTLK
jgi:dienelactone hydrolase